MKDKVLDDALAGLGIDGSHQPAKASTAASQPARQQPQPARQPAPVIDSETPRQLRSIFLLLAVALAIYVGQSALAEWRYQQARAELQKSGQATQKALRR